MRLLVTVGSTGFDALVQSALASPFLSTLSRFGIDTIDIQYGSSEHAFQRGVEHIQDHIVPVVHGFAYVPSMHEAMASADVIVSHAGSGSILEALRCKKRLVVVVNKSLMDNHQAELAQALQAQGYLTVATLHGLPHALKECLASTFKPFPEHQPHIFRSLIDAHMGFT